MIDKVLIFAFLSTSVGTKKILSCRLHLVKLFLFFFYKRMWSSEPQMGVLLMIRYLIFMSRKKLLKKAG